MREEIAAENVKRTKGIKKGKQEREDVNNQRSYTRVKMKKIPKLRLQTR